MRSRLAGRSRGGVVGRGGGWGWARGGWRRGGGRELGCVSRGSSGGCGDGWGESTYRGGGGWDKRAPCSWKNMRMTIPRKRLTSGPSAPGAKPR